MLKTRSGCEEKYKITIILHLKKVANNFCRFFGLTASLTRRPPEIKSIFGSDWSSWPPAALSTTWKGHCSWKTELKKGKKDTVCFFYTTGFQLILPVHSQFITKTRVKGPQIYQRTFRLIDFTICVTYYRQKWPFGQDNWICAKNTSKSPI